MILPWNIIKSSSLCWLCLYPVMLFTPRKYYNITVLSSFFVIGISSLCKKYICIIYLHYRYFLFCLLKKLSYLRYGMTTLFSVIASSNIWIWLKKYFAIHSTYELLQSWNYYYFIECLSKTIVSLSRPSTLLEFSAALTLTHFWNTNMLHYFLLICEFLSKWFPRSFIYFLIAVTTLSFNTHISL